MALDLEYPDDQCAYNRSGVLCGACNVNFSNVLGTSECRECRKPWVALIIPLFALVGVVLVAGLILFNLTVSFSRDNQWTYFLCEHSQGKSGCIFFN